MSDHETGSPASRLKGARKQLRLALEDVDDPAVAARIQDSRRSARAAHDALASVPITPDPVPEDTTGERLVECSVCGKTGLQERIHSLGCPHDGEDEERRVEYDAVAGWAAHALQGASNKYGVDSREFAGALYALGITLGAHDPVRQDAPHGTVDDTRARLLDAAGIDTDSESPGISTVVTQDGDQ